MAATLRLTASRQQVTCDGRTVPYKSGMVSAHKSESRTYGYYEMRARLPAGRGFWPAFWTMPNPPTQTVRAEIDIMENLGHEPRRAYMNVHWANNGVNGGNSTNFYEDARPSYADDFHTFAARWKAGTITWYIDGVARKTFNQSSVPGSYVPYQPMYAIANLAVGGNWPGAPDATTPFPATMYIDYIRAASPVAGTNPNLIPNPSFEAGPTEWLSHGDVAIGGTPRTGSYAATMSGEAGWRRWVTVKPYTVYQLDAYMYSPSGTSLMVGVKDYGGGQQLMNWTSATSYTKQSLVFMTGNTTQAFIFAYQDGGTGVVDDFSLTVLQ